jgi:hypothetical protein
MVDREGGSKRFLGCWFQALSPQAGKAVTVRDEVQEISIG